MPIRIDLALNPYPLELLEEALGCRIVMAVTPPTHTGNTGCMSLEKVLPVTIGVLTALEPVYAILRKRGLKWDDQDGNLGRDAGLWRAELLAAPIDQRFYNS